MKIISIIIAFILSINLITNAQVADYGQNPPSLTWKVIHASQFDLLFPAEMEAKAQELAASIEQLYGPVAHSLQAKPKPITIILQNQTAESNGFVLLAPRRTEFFATPPQDMEPADWLQSLAVHELRHVVQIDKSRQGFSKLISIIFGEEAQLALFGITLPPWFYEGDAVGIETALTNSGRGRLPQWEMDFRANLLSDKNYSYSKAYFGSFKDQVPDHYRLGYFMVSKLRRDYGDSIFNKVLDHTARYPFIPFPFSSSLKKYTGSGTAKLYKATVKELDSLWTGKQQPVQPAVPLNKRRNQVETHYLYPARLNKEEVICLKKGLAHTASITVLNTVTGKEQAFRKIGFQNTDHLHYANNKVVWDEMRFDKRYEYRSWSVICIADLKTGQTKVLTKRSKLFAPSLSPDAAAIVATELSDSHHAAIVILSAENGKVISRFEMDKGHFPQTPVFSPDGKSLLAVVSGEKGKSLLQIGLEDGKRTWLLPFSYQDISRPVFYEQKIIFHASWSGKDELYLFDPSKKDIRQLTHSAFGAFNPRAEAGFLLYNDFTASGYNIAELEMVDKKRPKADTSNRYFIAYYEPLRKREDTAACFNAPAKSYPVVDYPEWKKLFYFHSLTPDAMPPFDILTGDFLGLRLKSANLLNTLDAYASYGRTSGLNRWEAGLTFKKYYPLVNLSFVNSDRLFYTDTILFEAKENRYSAAIGLPFSFSRGSIFYYIRLDGGTSYSQRYAVENAPVNFIYEVKFPAHYQLQLSRNQRKAARDLAPRFGQHIFLNFSHYISDQKKGNLEYIRTIFYFPGFVRHHSFSLRYNEQEASRTFNTIQAIPVPRGYRLADKRVKVYNSLLLDYRFPLFYPDLELSSLAYIKRLKAGFFVDFFNTSLAYLDKEWYSFGLSLDADMNLLRFYLPLFEIGGKLIFFKDKGSPAFELNLGYNL